MRSRGDDRGLRGTCTQGAMGVAARAMKYTVAESLFGVQLFVASPDDLLIYKLIVARRDISGAG